MIAIRLKAIGTKNRKKWRIVVSESRSSRDTSRIEELGYYDPGQNPPVIQLDKERYSTWIKKGARPSSTVAALAKKKE